MATPKDFILYQDFYWTKNLAIQNCDSVFDLTGYTFSMPILTGIGGTVLKTLSLGSGMTVDLATGIISIFITAAQSQAWNLTGMPILNVTEFLGPDVSCCGNGSPCGPNGTDTQMGPTGVYSFIATDPSGNILQPWMMGSICVVPS
jgi:hypothetical protein